MKNIYKKICFILFLFFFFNSPSFSQKIVILNLDYIFNESLAGKSISSQLEKLNKKENDIFIKKENEIKEKEKNLISKKNILSEEAFKKDLNSLRQEIKEYQKEKKKKIEEYNLKKINAFKDLIEIINPLLESYSKENDISLVVDKKYIILGKTNTDITKDILTVLDKKINKIKIK